MFDFRLRVFHSIARLGSFSKAAEELHVSQPAVTKHIRLLEQHFGEKLFDRKGYKVELTHAGRVLIKHVNRIMENYQQLEFDMNLLQEATRGSIPMAASTTIAQYWLPPVLADFHKKFPEVKISMVNGNTTEVEGLVLKGVVQLGLIEGQARQNGLRYQPFLNDEIVLVVRHGHPLSRKGHLDLDVLKNLQLLIREPGSGTRQVLGDALREKNLALENLNIEMELGSSESIKSYLMHSDCCAFLSMHTVLDELKRGEFYVIDIKDFKVERQFYSVQLPESKNPLVRVFMNFMRLGYNQ